MTGNSYLECAQAAEHAAITFQGWAVEAQLAGDSMGYKRWHDEAEWWFKKAKRDREMHEKQMETT